MSKIIIESILLNQATLGASSPSPVSSGVIDLLPGHDFSAMDKLTFIITILNVTGSPTSGQLTAKFQLGNPHTGASSTSYPWTAPTLSDLSNAQKSALLTEGEDWPQPLALFSLGSSVTFKRTIKDFGSICNLHLDASTLAGGTNPKFTISAVLIQESS